MAYLSLLEITAVRSEMIVALKYRLISFGSVDWQVFGEKVSTRSSTAACYAKIFDQGSFDSLWYRLLLNIYLSSVVTFLSRSLDDTRLYIDWVCVYFLQPRSNIIVGVCAGKWNDRSCNHFSPHEDYVFRN